MLDLDQEELPQSNTEVDWLDGVKRVNKKSDLKDLHQYRMIGGLFGVATHTIKWTGKTDGKEKSWTKLCPRLNPATCKLDRVYPEGHPEAGKLVRCPDCERTGGSPVKFQWYMNLIDRPLQAMGAANPIVLLNLPETVVVKQIQGRKKLNVHNGVGYSPAHEVYGFDLYIKFDPNGKGEAMYTVQNGTSGLSPLTAAEKAYQLYDVQQLYVDKALPNNTYENLKGFLEKVGLLPKSASSAPTTQMPMSAPSILDAPSDMPWNAPAVAAPVVAAPSFVAPTMAAPAFTAPVAAAPDVSSRFGGAPPVVTTMPAQPEVAPVTLPVVSAGGHPACFKNEDIMGGKDCLKCPSRIPCFAS